VIAAAPAPAPAPAFTPGASDYDEGDSPTQYQPMPEGFSDKTQPPQQAPVGPSSEPPTAIHSPATAAAMVSAPSAATADDEEAMSEERTRVLAPTDVEPPKPAPQPAAGSPKRTMLGMAPPPPTSDAINQMARGAAPAAQPRPAQAPAPAAKPERPEPPSVPQSKESATVVRPLEEFLAEAGQRALPQEGAAGAGQSPPWAPDPFGQTQPPQGRGQQAGAYGAPAAGAYGAQPPGGYDAQQAAAYGAQQPGAQQAGAYGAQQAGAYGAQQPGAYGAQQPGAYGAQQAGAYGAQQAGAYGAHQAGAYGAQQAGAYGAQQAGAHGAQQPGSLGVGGQSGSYGMPGNAGASGQYPPQQFGPDASGQYGQQQYPGAGYPQQAWGTQQPAQPAKGPLAMWKAMPFPRKLMFIMLPFGLIAFIIVFSDPPARKRAPGESSSATPASSASGAPGASAALSGAPPASVAPPGGELSTPSTASAAPPDSTASAAPPEAVKSAEPTPSASAPPLAKGEVTLERKAADAVASNEFAKAAELYEQLAKQHPDNPAYARGAEILRKKAKK
jgi:hypothetical protein